MTNTYKVCRLDCKVALFPMTSGIAPPMFWPETAL